MVCRGANCSVTFDACTFSSCKLVAIDGAQVSLANSLIEASMSEIGLLAHGADTHVEAANSIIMEGKQGASAQGGAQITLRDCSCSGASVVGEAREEGSRIKLLRSFVGDMKGAGTSFPPD